MIQVFEMLEEAKKITLSLLEELEMRRDQGVTVREISDSLQTKHSRITDSVIASIFRELEARNFLRYRGGRYRLVEPLKQET